jgi:formylglycine-generating enzyme required for sulfatase activity
MLKIIERVCLIMAFGCLAVFTARGNNLRLSRQVLLEQDSVERRMSVGFDLNWENSWRNITNYDAAWVFIKFRAAGSNEWQHGYLVDEDVHVVPGGRVERGLSTVGEEERVVGVFISSASALSGSANYSNVRLVWDYGASGYEWAQGTPVEVSVHAMEMVYVAEGAFYLGSGGTESGSFTDGAWSSGASIPYLVESEAVITIAAEPGALWGRSDSGNNSIGTAGELPAAFPKGYASFYCMKYPLTEAQHVAFLNHLTAAQAELHHSGMAGSYGNTVQLVEGGYVTEAPDRACGYLSWADGAAYLDWSGLRPITETEFEKAGRGGELPVPNECAWGDTTATYQTGFDGIPGSGSETAVPVKANLVRQSTLGSLTRVGIFATAESDRIAAGASYWGIMELSSHPVLLMVSVGRTRGRVFVGSHGDGELSVAGYGTNSDWPGYNATTEVISGGDGAGFRGADFNNPNSLLPQISNRNNASYATSGSTRFAHYGVRGVRSAPVAD